MGNEKSRYIEVMGSAEKWLWASLVFGAGSKYIREIIYRYESIDEAYEKLALSSVNEAEEEIKMLGITSSQMCRRIRTTPVSQCEMIEKYCTEKNISIISYDDENYPENLRNIDDPPAVLFCMGDVSVLQKQPAVSVVGTRKASEYSLKVTDVICRNLAEDGFVIVSGFANGIDSAAHNAAVKAGGKTIAVLGCGNDVEYPKGSIGRRNDIISSGGLIVSEYLPGTTPIPANFPKRNRILAALGLGTFIIQAPSKSGSLITAELALGMGKDIFCIPPTDIFDKSYEGVVKYLREGAIPVFSHLDIVNAYYYSYAHTLRADKIFSFYQKKEENSDKREKNQNDDKKIKRKRVTEKQKTEKITEEERIEEKSREIADKDFSEYQDESQRKILQFMQSEKKPVHADEISEKTGLDPMEIMAALTELEIFGAVSQMSGNMYCLK